MERGQCWNLHKIFRGLPASPQLSGQVHNHQPGLVGKSLKDCGVPRWLSGARRSGEPWVVKEAKGWDLGPTLFLVT